MPNNKNFAFGFTGSAYEEEDGTPGSVDGRPFYPDIKLAVFEMFGIVEVEDDYLLCERITSFGNVPISKDGITISIATDGYLPPFEVNDTILAVSQVINDTAEWVVVPTGNNLCENISDE